MENFDRAERFFSDFHELDKYRYSLRPKYVKNVRWPFFIEIKKTIFSLPAADPGGVSPLKFSETYIFVTWLELTAYVMTLVAP